MALEGFLHALWVSDWDCFGECDLAMKTFDQIKADFDKAREDYLEACDKMLADTELMLHKAWADECKEAEAFTEKQGQGKLPTDPEAYELARKPWLDAALKTKDIRQLRRNSP